MAESPSNEAAELYRQATEQFEAAVKASVKIQEETFKLFLDLWTDSQTPSEWRQRAQAAMGRLVPAARANLEEAARLVSRNAKASLELVEKAFQAGSPAEAQAAARACWETMFAALRDNAQALLDANARAVQSWTETIAAMGGGTAKQQPTKQSEG
jgi:hypothetical protein